MNYNEMVKKIYKSYSSKIFLFMLLQHYLLLEESFYLLKVFFCPDDDGVAKCVYTSKDLLSAHNIIVKACMSICIGLRCYQNYILPTKWYVKNERC